MPRPARLNVPNFPQHITQRGNNRQPCFFYDKDYRLYLDLLVAACHRHECELHAFVLMTNHVHLLITPRVSEGVSLVMRDVGRDYVRSINKAYCRSGTMWEGRFKSSLVAKDRYCLDCYRYVELNPVRAGIVHQPSEYRWSSFRHNALGQCMPFITPHDVWLQLGTSNIERRRTYCDLFRETLEQRMLAEIRHGVGKGLPTGNDQIKSEIGQVLSISLRDGKLGRPRKASPYGERRKRTRAFRKEA